MKLILSIYHRRLMAAGLFLLIVSVPAAGQSLREVVDLALEANKTLAAQSDAVSESRLYAKAATRATLPRLDFDASYRHVTDRAELDISKINPLSNAKIGLGVYDTYDTGITLSYPLFTGFALSNQVKLKKQQSEMAEVQLEKSRKAMAFQTIATYRQAQNYTLEIESLQAAQTRIQLQLKRLKSAVSQGMALPVDTLSLALAKLSYDQKIITAKAGYETALQKLEDYTGKKIDIVAANLLKSETRFAGLQFDQVDDLRLLSIRKSVSETGRKLSEATYFPNVGVFVSYKYAKPGVDFITNEWMGYGAWGINMSWNLFSWGSDRLTAEAGKVAVNKINNQYEAAKDEKQTVYDEAVREFQALEEQNAVVVATLDLAKQKMKIINSQFREGMSSTTDFNVANLELTEAEIAQKRQLILMAIKQNEIDFLSGISINEWSIE